MSCTRQVVGITICPLRRRFLAALVRAEGQGYSLHPVVQRSLQTSISAETATSVQSLRVNCSDVSLETRDELSECLSEHAIGLIHRLIDDLPPSEHPLVITVDDPGLWSLENGRPVRFHSLMDANWIAEATGQNILDALPAKDILQHGRGGPLTAAGQWLFLGPRRAPHDQATVYLEIDHSLSLTFLPAIGQFDVTAPLLSVALGPGLSLVEPLVRDLTHGAQLEDVRGTLAVQGRRIEELLQRWLAHPPTSYHWSIQEPSADSMLAVVREMSGQQGWSTHDVLCTAHHHIAACVETALAEQLPRSRRVAEVVVGGRGRRNGLLLHEFNRRFPSIAFRPLDQFAMSEEAIGPASIAILGFFHIDQIPACPTTLTGAVAPRVLGRLTPGNPAAWNRLVPCLGDNRLHAMTLRSAI